MSLVFLVSVALILPRVEGSGGRARVGWPCPRPAALFSVSVVSAASPTYVYGLASSAYWTCVPMSPLYTVVTSSCPSPWDSDRLPEKETP